MSQPALTAVWKWMYHTGWWLQPPPLSENGERVNCYDCGSRILDDLVYLSDDGLHQCCLECAYDRYHGNPRRGIAPAPPEERKHSEEVERGDYDPYLAGFDSEEQARAAVAAQHVLRAIERLRSPGWDEALPGVVNALLQATADACAAINWTEDDWIEIYAREAEQFLELLLERVAKLSHERKLPFYLVALGAGFGGHDRLADGSKTNRAIPRTRDSRRWGRPDLVDVATQSLVILPRTATVAGLRGAISAESDGGFNQTDNGCCLEEPPLLQVWNAALLLATMGEADAPVLDLLCQVKTYHNERDPAFDETYPFFNHVALPLTHDSATALTRAIDRQIGMRRVHLIGELLKLPRELNESGVNDVLYPMAHGAWGLGWDNWDLYELPQWTATPEMRRRLVAAFKNTPDCLSQMVLRQRSSELLADALTLLQLDQSSALLRELLWGRADAVNEWKEFSQVEKHRDAKVRCSLAMSLTELLRHSDSDEEVCRLLREMCSDSDADVRRIAQEALKGDADEPE